MTAFNIREFFYESYQTLNCEYAAVYIQFANLLNLTNFFQKLFLQLYIKPFIYVFFFK